MMAAKAKPAADDPQNPPERPVSICLVVTKRGEGAAIALSRALAEAGYEAAVFAVRDRVLPAHAAVGPADVLVVAVDLLVPLTRHRRRWLTERARTSRIVLMADGERMLDAFELLDLADGVVFADAGHGRIATAVEVAMAGYMTIPPYLASSIGSDRLRRNTLMELSPQQRLVLDRLARGLTNREIAEALDLSEAAVRTQVRAVLTRLRLPNRTRAAMFAIRHGLLLAEGSGRSTKG